MKKAYKLLRVNGVRVTGKNRFAVVKRKRRAKKVKQFDPRLKWTLVFAGLCILVVAFQIERVIVIENNSIDEIKSAITNWNPCDLKMVVCDGEYMEEFEATATAYNTFAYQTDSSPCIAANNQNICGRDDVVACPSRFKFGTKVEILEKVYECSDRMAAKYRDQDWFDISMDKDIAGAINFGKRSVIVKVLN